MTLKNLKRNLKIALVGTSVILYSGLFYVLGRNSISLKNLIAGPPENQNQKIDRPAPATDTQIGQVIASQVKLCANATYGFEVSYPSNWFTTYDNDRQKCTLFAPYSFVALPQGDNDIPIKIEVIRPEEWLDTVKFHTNPNDFWNIASVANMEIGDKSAVKVESVATSAGKTPKGFVKITFLVLTPQNPLAIYYQQQDQNEKVEELKTTLEEMVRGLRFF